MPNEILAMRIQIIQEQLNALKAEHVTPACPAGPKQHEAAGKKGGRTQHPTAKVNEDAVRLIRQRIGAGESRQELAREYGMTPSGISAITRRRTWKHVF